MAPVVKSVIDLISAHVLTGDVFFFLFFFLHRLVHPPAIDHPIVAALIDARGIDAVNRFTNDQPHWLWLVLIAIDD